MFAFGCCMIYLVIQMRLHNLNFKTLLNFKNGKKVKKAKKYATTGIPEDVKRMIKDYEGSEAIKELERMKKLAPFLGPIFDELIAKEKKGQHDTGYTFL